MTRTPLWLLLSLVLCSPALVITPVAAATIDNPAILPGGDGGADDQFGSALALSGDTLIVGVPRDNPVGAGSGSVYVFTRSGGLWTVQQRLVAADATAGESFGYAVALHGDTLIVGAPNGGAADEGSAYIFERSAGVFVQQQKLVITPMAQPRNFGWSVAAGPDVVWVGSPSHRIVGAFQGSATQYKRQAGVWQEGPTFGPFTGSGGEVFGFAMGYADGRLIVGEKGEDVGAQGFAGAAIAYRYDGTLTEQQIFSAPGVLSFDQFGSAVAVDGTRAVIGAPSSQRAGYAQPFRFDGTQWLADGPPLSTGAIGFGHAVAIDGARIAVANPDGAGFVQVYERRDGVWTARESITPPDLVSGDAFGSALQFDGPDVVVGMPGRDLAGGAVDVGQARTFSVPADPVYRDGFE